MPYRSRFDGRVLMGILLGLFLGFSTDGAQSVLVDGQFNVANRLPGYDNEVSFT